MKNVYTICYNTLAVWENKQEAIKDFTYCYYFTEGSEHDRYGHILIDLNNSNIGLDGVSNKVWKICFKNKDNKTIEIETQDYMDVIKKVEEGVYDGE